MTTAAQAARSADLGRPWARKTGRDARWPYVPVVLLRDDAGFERESQIMGKAFATRTEAEGYAARHIDQARADLLRRLGDPRLRALRRMYGVDEPVAVHRTVEAIR